ncbi:cell wall assembly regulator SMI1 [Jatrophihabitans sp. GAS493]|uniref:SMI1/KNR4 family protein n=1 Tax=Jatrophihabitans sp. GAS493 TaxID=1907575 RepID=UPI000BC079D6|nr:SMI1/KNR4 family protein [Jatrophihabitans sp. GAS493]SOD73462.1 cell wall assembly regulator SMI1 [Jatrophihabitans sp. GAS493]
MQEQWSRVLDWLRTNAPASYSTLQPPATYEEILAAQQRLAVALPVGLVSLLSMTNGVPAYHPVAEVSFASRFLPGGYMLQPVADIPGYVDMLNGILDQGDPMQAGWWWHRQWLTFASHVCADALFLDLRPGPDYGRVGAFMHEEIADFDAGAHTLEAWVAGIADALEGQYDFGYWRPAVIDGRLEWDVIADPSDRRDP